MRPAWVLQLLCLLYFCSATVQAVSKTATVSGKLLWPGGSVIVCASRTSLAQILPSERLLRLALFDTEETVQAGDVRLLLTLDGGQQVYAWPQASGRFAFHEVPAGSHLLDILAVGAIYPEVDSYVWLRVRELAAVIVLKPEHQSQLV